MKRRIEKSALAKHDLAVQAAYLRQESPPSAIRFLEAAEKTFEELAAMPGLGAVEDFSVPQLQGLRCWKIRGFEKVLVFYLPIDRGIRVMRVLHGARDIPAILGR